MLKTVYKYLANAAPMTLDIFWILVIFSVCGMATLAFLGENFTEAALPLLVITISGSLILLLALAFISWLTDLLGKNAPAATVTFDELSIRCPDPNGEIRKIEWQDIRTVLIETTDGGPFSCDVFWVLLPQQPDGQAVIIPSDADGASELLEAMQERLDGFDNMSVTVAMGSTENAVFRIWEAGE